MRVIQPIGLATSVTKSNAYFCHMRWHGRRVCPRCSFRRLYKLYHYRGVPRRYFHLYIKEIEFRFNNRDEDLFPLLARMLVKLVPDN